MSSWILRTSVPDSSKCVAKQWRSEWGVIGFLMPDTRWAFWQACSTAFLVLLCQSWSFSGELRPQQG